MLPMQSTCGAICSFFFRSVWSRSLSPPKKPLNPDARLPQIYPSKDFTSSLRRQHSWSSGTQQGPITRLIFGQWMRADIYPLGSAYVPCTHFSFSYAHQIVYIWYLSIYLVATCITSTSTPTSAPAPDPTIQQRGQQGSSRRRPIRSSMIPIQCSSSIRFLPTPVVCLDGFLSKELSTVRAYRPPKGWLSHYLS